MRWLAIAFMLMVQPVMADTYRTFGDSIARGDGASVPANAWSAMVAAELGRTNNNFASGGDMVADIVRRGIYGQTLAAGDISAIYAGTNDQWKYGTNATKRAYTISGLRNVILWLATTSKVKAIAGGVESGAWANTPIIGVGRYTTQVGATKEFTCNGTIAYVGILGADNGLGAQYEILKNDVSVGTFNSNVPGVKTYNNWPYLDYVDRIPCQPGDVIKVKNLGGNLHVQWFTDNNQAVKPRVVFGTVVKMSPAAYAQWGGSDANVAAFNADYLALASALQADGFDVVLADNSANNNSTDLLSDGVHPSNAGHLKMKDAYSAALGQQQPPPEGDEFTFENVPVYRRKLNDAPDGTFWIDDGAERKQITVQP